MSSLRKFIATQHKKADELPLIHTTRCEWLENFIGQPQITPRRCKVFKENLIYLFYGRPAYRSKSGKHPGEGSHLCPICFVFKPQTVSRNVRRIFPCDTGAVAEGVFRPELMRKQLSKLGLDPQIESAQKLVAHFFETNGDYFSGKIRSSIKSLGAGVAKKWYALNIKKGKTKGDDRRSVVEVQVDKPIELADQLLCVVLPREFMEDPKIRDAIFLQWKTTALLYRTTEGAPPADGYPLLRATLEEHFRKEMRI